MLLESDDSSPESGDAIKQWNDRASVAGSMIQLTGTNQPVYYDNILNGRGGVLFDNAGDNMALAGSYTVSQGFTVYIVINQADTSTNRYFLQGTSTVENVGAEAFVNRLRFRMTSTALANNANSSGGLLIRVSFNGASSQVITKNITDTTIDTGTSDFNFKYLGGQFNSMDAYLHEVMIYDSVLSAGDDALVQSYLRDKWGSGI